MSTQTELPIAAIRPRRRFPWFWLLPLMALFATGALIVNAWYQQGILIQLNFERGHGLKQGDALIHRGIEIGRVTTVKLTPDLNQVHVEVRVHHSAKDVARQGSRFWIVRPQVDISGVAGLDTVIGANYLRVLPGAGALQYQFTGLETPPLLDELDSGGLQIILRTVGKGGLQRNAPVIYRQVIIGKIVQVDLAPDASAVEALLYIKPKYTHLIRDNTRFWRISGATIQAGWLSGLSLQLDSIQSLVAGGVMLAIPPQLGALANARQRFNLHDAPQAEWLEWTAYVNPLSDDVAALETHPPLLFATLSWYPDNYFTQWFMRTQQGWLLPIKDGMLAPADLVSVPAAAQADSVYLHMDDVELQLQQQAQTYVNGVKFLPYLHQHPDWQPIPQRIASAPEDVLLFTAPNRAVRHISTDLLQAQDTDTGLLWQVDSSLQLDGSWHGAAVLASQDHALLGMLLVSEQQLHIALFNQTFSLAPLTQEHSE